MIFKRWISTFLAGSSLALVAALWLIFAPTALGGRSDYVTINGNSMEPAFHGGDLVIVQQPQEYQVGDIVAYRDPTLNRVIFHRIIAINLDQYILKGDNNSWIDAYQPGKIEIIGKIWQHISRAGYVLVWIRTPIIFSSVVSAASLIVILMLIKEPRIRRKRVVH